MTRRNNRLDRRLALERELMRKPHSLDQMIGLPYGFPPDVEIVSVRCPRCELIIDAADWEDHRDKTCPAREPVS